MTRIEHREVHATFLKNVQKKLIDEGTHYFLTEDNSRKASARIKVINRDKLSKGEHTFQNITKQKQRNLNANHKRHHLRQDIYNPSCEKCIIEHSMNHKVISVEPDGYEDVYDLTVDKYHNFTIDVDKGKDCSSGVVVHNCGEILLESGEVCNLSEVFPTRCSNKSEFISAVKSATFYSSTVSLYPTHSMRTNEVVARNRRIGVSLSGIAEWFDTYKPNEAVRWMKDAYSLVKSYNIQLAAEAGVTPSIRLTTVKPSGSISQLVGVPSGMHFPIFKYAIRRIIVSTTSPIVDRLIQAGYKYEPLIRRVGVSEYNNEKIYDKYNRNKHTEKGWENNEGTIALESQESLVFEVPIYSGKAREAKQVSSWEQFSILETLQREWADNSVSATISYDRNTEANQLNHQLAQFIPVIKSVSMLPHSDEGSYDQMPYQGITKEEYESRISNLTKLDLGNLLDSTLINQEGYCTTDKCELK
jgi:ribonucleoside-diphosphate reductase alpha chain